MNLGVITSLTNCEYCGEFLEIFPEQKEKKCPFCGKINILTINDLGINNKIKKENHQNFRINLEFLDTEEQIKKLRQGDKILVKWCENYVTHTPGIKDIMLYDICEIKDYCHEIICQKKHNHYFNYKEYLKNNSNALEVYKLIF